MFRKRVLLGLTIPISLILVAACSATDAHRGEDPSTHTPREDAHPNGEPGIVRLTPHQLDAAGLETAEAQLRPLEPEIETTGEVDYEQNRVAHVGPRIAGRLERVDVDLGDLVRRGDVLAVIDSVELGEARARYLAALSHEDLSRRTFKRQRALFEQRITSEQKMQEAESAVLEATARREGAEQTLRLYGVDPERISAGDTPSRLDVKAPIDGRVVSKHATLGEMVMPSDALFTLADLSRVWVWIDVFERNLAAVHEDDGVEVRVKAYPNRTFSGRVSYLASEVEPETRTVRARIDVPNAERLLRPGMFAEIRLTDPHGPRESSVLAVPESAVVRSHGRAQDAAIIFRPVGDGGFRAVTVRIGRRQGDWVEVLDGLEAGDPIVVSGAFLLKSELSRSELGGGHSH